MSDRDLDGLPNNNPESNSSTLRNGENPFAKIDEHHIRGSLGNLEFTPLESIPKIHEKVRATFKNGTTRPIEWRLKQIKQLGFMIQENQDQWTSAITTDLGRPSAEAHLSEIMCVVNECTDALRNLRKWAKPKRVSTALAWKASTPAIYYEPKGTVLVIGTWNYPVVLLLAPAIGALASGNSVVLKPAEQSAAVAALVAKLVPQYLDSSAVAVVNGAIEEAQLLLSLKWDHIFFTGSASVGKIVAKAAAEHLTPVTLELGGKCPAIVMDGCDMATTGRRLVWGKVVNAGQTCIAPDYVLCPAHLQDSLIASMKAALDDFYPSKQSLLTSPQFSKIINAAHFKRLTTLLSGTKGEVVIGGETDPETNKISVTVIKGVMGDDTTMADEIFGPVLPIVTVESKEEAVRFVGERNQPLAIYVFAKRKSDMNFIREHTHSGQLLYNDVLVQFLIPGLPFGGTGASGNGNYHGKFSFLTFSHQRAVATGPPWMDPLLAARYPPYSDGKLKLMQIAIGSKIRGKSTPAN